MRRIIIKKRSKYKSLGFEKIAKIGNYYTTDRQFFDSFYQSEDTKENEGDSPLSSKSNGNTAENGKNIGSEAYLYCRGDLSHCRLLLGMEYFNYKKWPKPKNMTKEEEMKMIENNKDNKDKKKRNYGPKIMEEYLQKRIADYHAKQQKEQLLLRKSGQSGHRDRDRDRDRGDKKHHNHHSTNPYKQKPATKTTKSNTVHIVSSPNMNGHHIHRSSRHQSDRGHRSSHYNNSTQNIHHQHANSNHSNHSNQFDQYQPHRSSSPYIHDNNKRTIRFQQHQNHKNDGNHYIVSSGDHRSYKNFREQPPTRYYYQEPPAKHENDNNQTLSPNIGLHHKNSSIVSDAASSINTVNSSINGVPKSSRHSSIANSQISHHYHGSSGHYYHAHPSYHGHHSNRPTYTQSSQVLTTTSTVNRPSVTPTPTYDVTHSQAVYYPHLNSTGSGDTAHSKNRGNSFYSTQSSNASHHSIKSHHSHHTSHSHAAIQSHHSMNSNASIHSDPYHSGYHHRQHQQHYIHHDHPYNNHLNQRHSGNHHKHYNEYNNDEYIVNHHSSHKSGRNKRYRQTQRHKKPQ